MSRVGVSLTIGVLVAICAAVWGSSDASAMNEYRELYRGARAQAMGNAFTAVADDEQALYYNPAGLAGIDSTTFHLVNASGEIATSVLSEYKTFGDTFSSGLSANTLNSLIGKNIYTRGTFSPTFVMPNFAIGFLADQQLALRTQNRVLPTTHLGYQSTLGFQAGFGFSLTGNSRNKTSDLRVGMAAKVLWRRGGFYDLPLSDVLTISQDQLKQTIGSYQPGYGADLGLQWIRNAGKALKLKAGLVWTEIGDVAFAGNSSAQKSNLSAGVAATYEPGMTRLTLAADYRQLFRTDDWRKNAHLGAEFALPLLSIYAGLSQMLLSYGLGINLELFRVTALSYSEQLSTFAFQETERRYMLQVALRFGF